MGVFQTIEPTADREKLRDQGQLLRGQFLDGFARLEASVLEYVLRLDLKLPANAPFSQRLRALRSVRHQFRHPKKLDERLDEIITLSAIRADIVHAVLETVQVWDGKVETRFLQFRNTGNPAAQVRQLSHEELGKLSSRAAVLAHQFSQQQLKAPAPAASASASG